MDNLMVLEKQFEGTNVEIIRGDNGELLFELYSTGSALGYSRWTESKGKKYFKIEKARINKVIENASITGLAHNGQTYLTEETLYDFMLEAKTEKVKPFRKWVTSEVLPSLRKHGTYAITTQQPSELVANLVQSTMTAILPVITEQMAKVTIKNQQQINQMVSLMHDQINKVNKFRKMVGNCEI